MTPRIKEILNTERLTLRPPSTSDFEAVHSYASNPENLSYVSWGPNTEEQTKEYLASSLIGRDFVVVLNSMNAVIGGCGIYPDNTNDTAALGWVLHKDYWNHGYGTELARELIRYGFEDLGLRRIYAVSAALNYGSCRVMENNGMRREALHRQAFWARLDKIWVDKALYAILAEEFRSQQEA